MARSIYYVACKSTKEGMIGSFVWLINGVEIGGSSFNYGKCDQLTAELKLISEILSANKGYTLDVFCPFDHVHEVVKNEYVKKWEMSGWKTLKDTPVQNQYLWKQVSDGFLRDNRLVLLKKKDLKNPNYIRALSIIDERINQKISK